jgi:NADP-dependent 3-hydroxy acid dehydrogenase YdfG
MFEGQMAVITGASSGIGSAIAVALGRVGAQVCLIGRDQRRLEDVVAQIGPGAEVFRANLAAPDDLERLVRTLASRHTCIDLLIHSAGHYETASFATAPVEHFDAMYAVNVRAPFRLTQALLPALVRAQGQVVFINSSAGVRAASGVAQYAATKHALKALADSLRDEINPQGVRVISVYPGRTTGPLQERLFGMEGRPYEPALLLQQDDVVQSIVSALTLPRTAEVTDLMIRPFKRV